MLFLTEIRSKRERRVVPPRATSVSTDYCLNIDFGSGLCRKGVFFRFYRYSQS